jgi:tetratricopeptide (TPR) repeat protein
MRKGILIAAVCAAALFMSCETLGRPGDQPKGEVKKAPQLTEGQLQEQYIARRNEGRKLLESRQYGKALDAYLEANEIRTNSAEILLGIGQAYLGLEYWDKAKTFFDRYLALEKDRDPETYRMIARLYGDRLEFFDLAVKVWSKAIDANAASPLATDYYNRGLMYQRLGKKDEPVADYKVAIDLARKNKDDKLVTIITNAMAGLAGSK